MRFIDSHAHLADPAFDDDRDAVVSRAREVGAAAVVSIGESIAAADRAALIASSYHGFVFHTAGVHPHDAGQFDAARDIDAIRRHREFGAVAVGECGLDYHYDHSPREVQREVFAHLPRVTAYSIVQPGRMAAELERVRQQGYAQTSEEMSLGACSVAVPVFGPDARVVAAVGIVVPSLKRDKNRLVAALQVAARGIGRTVSG